MQFTGVVLRVEQGRGKVRSVMDITNWLSERVGKWVNLQKLSKSDLISEVTAERRAYLKLEKECLGSKV